MKISYKQIKTSVMGFLCAVLQCCTHDTPSPVQPSGNLTADPKAGNIITIREKYRKDPFSNKSEKEDGTVSRLIYVCESVYYVGYDVNSGEQVFHDYLGRECIPFDDGTGTGGGGGGNTGGNGGGGGTTGGNGGSTSNGSYGETPTTDPYNQKPPADCDSWLFRSVGPSRYMACGVRDIRIDIWHNFIDNQNRPSVYYFHFTFDVYPLYFEMPPSYTPGQAATVCAELKDQAERFVENKYGSSAPLNADVIANAFYARLASLMQAAGGRLSKSANYPNTPLGIYEETLMANNGGCS